MDTKSKSLLEAALELPESERAEIAAELLATLGPDDTQVNDEELSNELERRLEECRREPSLTIPWSLTRIRRLPSMVGSSTRAARLSPGRAPGSRSRTTQSKSS